MSVETPVYLDNHATTRVDPRVVEAMLPYFETDYGNASSLGHVFGQRAKAAVDRARESIAASINAAPNEIFFTSGATESNNSAIIGTARRQRRRGDHIISVRTEHAAVLDPLARLEREGYQTTLLDVERHGSRRAGLLDPQRVAEAITPQTALVSVMLANNEFGVVQPLAQIADVCQASGVVLHCDATQAVGKIPVDVRRLGVDLMSFTAHKMYGPKGVGALYVRRTRPAIRLEPLIVGGGHQEGRRSGTLNVPGIVGLARALDLCIEELDDEMPRLTRLRGQLWALLSQRIEAVVLCGPEIDATNQAGDFLRLPGNLNACFTGLDGEAMQLQMPELAVSSGAACSSLAPGPSRALLALGLDEDQARSSLRFGLGRFTTPAEVELAAAAVERAAQAVRALQRGAAN